MTEFSKKEAKDADAKVIANVKPRIPSSLPDIPGSSREPLDASPPFRSANNANLPADSQSPNWIFWLALPKIEPWQACVLAHNIDPDAVVVKRYMHPMADKYLISADEGVISQINQLLKLLMANEFERPFSGFNDGGVRLWIFAQWCVRIGWDIPQELIAFANRKAARAKKVAAVLAALPTPTLAADERLKTLAENKQLRLPDWIEISGIKKDAEGKERSYKITEEGIRFAGWPDDLIEDSPPLWQADMLRQNEAPGLTFPCTPNELVDFVDSDAGSMFGSLFVPDVFRDAVKAQSATDADTPAAGTEKEKPPLQQPFQEQEILRVIRELSYDPKNLPKQSPGKPGVKAEVRKKLNLSVKVFDKAWERLRANQDIQDAE